MIIQFRGKSYEIADLVNKDSEVIIKVVKYGFIPIPPEVSEIKRHFPNFLRKLIFFLIHEGISLTLSKVRAWILQQKIVSERQVVFAYGLVKGTKNFAVAIGPQDCPNSEYLSFPKELIVYVNKQSNVKKYYQKVLDYFIDNKEMLEMLYNYSPYSGVKLGLRLKDIISSNLNGNIPTDNLKLLKIQDKRPSRRKVKSKILKNKYDLFLAGAGTYACSYILPTLKNVNYHTIIDLNPILACLIGERYNFLYKDTSTERALRRLNDSENPILIVATYHSTHLPIVEQALSINPNTKIFLEKPPVTSEEQLRKLAALRENPNHFIEIGYNRRHSPFIQKAREIITQCGGPITMTCIIKELNIPLSYWYYWPTQGTRVTGNLCHWIDLGIYFIQQNPVSITAISASDKFPADEISVAVVFADGSLLTLIASDRGNQLRGVQEFIEIRRGDTTITIDDFLKMKVQKGGSQKFYRRIIRDKGHKQMYKKFLYLVNNNMNALYPNRDLFLSTNLYLSISKMLLSNVKHQDLVYS
jgi:predicted dehydrogenase